MGTPGCRSFLRASFEPHHGRFTRRMAPRSKANPQPARSSRPTRCANRDEYPATPPWSLKPGSSAGTSTVCCNAEGGLQNVGERLLPVELLIRHTDASPVLDRCIAGRRSRRVGIGKTRSAKITILSSPTSMSAYQPPSPRRAAASASATASPSFPLGVYGNRRRWTFVRKMRREHGHGVRHRRDTVVARTLDVVWRGMSIHRQPDTRVG
jgi:hypothetical protein